MPFQGHTFPGYEYRTLLIEPPVFLARLARSALSSDHTTHAAATSPMAMKRAVSLPSG